MAARNTRDLATAAYLHMHGVRILSVRRDGRGFVAEYEDDGRAAGIVEGWPNSSCCRFDSSMLVLKRNARRARFEPVSDSALQCDVGEAAYLHMHGVRLAGCDAPAHGPMRFMFENGPRAVEVLSRYVNDECCRFAASVSTLKKMGSR